LGVAYGAIDRLDFERVLVHLPANRRAIADWVEARCESLPESLTRTRLRLLGYQVDIQVRLNDLERIDLVVDDCVGIETDGRAFHLETFEVDRMKDVDITIADMHPLRPSANMVFTKWPRIELAVRRAIAARPPVCACGNSGTAVEHPLTPPEFPRRSVWRKTASPEFPKRRAGGGSTRDAPGGAPTVARRARPG
jgi:hypothetical protein